VATKGDQLTRRVVEMTRGYSEDVNILRLARQTVNLKGMPGIVRRAWEARGNLGWIPRAWPGPPFLRDRTLRTIGGL